MTLEQKEHLRWLRHEFIERIGQKYEAGTKAHGGNLWDNEKLLDEAISECIDQFAYLMTLKAQIERPQSANKYRMKK